jgi:MerR family transcriptional regulator/heat shock protein HspR
VKRIDPDQPIYVISIAAELAGVHPQTLRVYERKGLLTPKRTEGNSRRYDVDLLRRIQDLTSEGLNLAGVMKVLELEHEHALLRRRYERALHQVELLESQLQEAIHSQGSGAMIPFRDIRRIRRAMKVDQIDEMTRARVFAVPPVRDPDETRK